MSWLVDTRGYGHARPDAIGPGRLVLVVGPSGAGKDTLIRGARDACAGDPSVAFPRRTVTRESTLWEDHDTMSAEDFRHAVAAGAFALWWDAHGHSYGIAALVDDDIRASRTVVCNVSRTIIGFARIRYASVVIVQVTAPPDVLAARLANRQRPSDGNHDARLGRMANGQDIEPDVVIRNVGRPEVGVRRILNVIRDPGFVVVW
jgi:ribose 1,5-bisphosphokinase